MLQPWESSPLRVKIYMHARISRISISQARLGVNLEHPSKCTVHMPACSIGSYSYIYTHIWSSMTSQPTHYPGSSSSHHKYICLLFNNRYRHRCHIAHCVLYMECSGLHPQALWTKSKPPLGKLP